MAQVRDVPAGRRGVAADAPGDAAATNPAGAEAAGTDGRRDEPVRPEVPARAAGVTMVGEMAGSGYREPPALVRRGDGQTLQLSPLLYLVLAASDGTRDYDAVAAAVSEGYGRTVSADNVRHLVDEKLRPLGLLKRPDGSEPELKRSNPLLALRFKYAVTDPERTRRLTAPFQWLFHPAAVVPVLAGFAVVAWWVLLDKGLASATYQAFDRPALLLLVFAITVLSAGFHEFGHAAAARYSGATPGVMGAGVYLVWPAFYTDVTDSYRLGRAGRLRTDLGGLYFNAIVAVVIAGVWWATAYDALLLIVATQVLQMVRQLTPLVRFDGYHVLADLTGVPDLFHRIKPTLLGLLPWRRRDAAASALKPWARAVVTVWVLAVVPLLLFSLTMMVFALPRLLGTAWVKLVEQQSALGDAFGRGDLVEVAARALAMVALAFPVLASFVVLGRVLRRVATSTWRRTAGRPARRATALGVAAALVAGLAWAWWPHPGTYRPVQPYERGTLLDGVSALPVSRPAVGLHDGSGGVLTTVWPSSEPLPTADHPKLAVVLVPHGTRDGSGTGTGQDTGWVFPFDKPLAPGPGDNQALAVNTTDGTAAYDVAFALVWADGSKPVTSSNQAYAAAKCKGCAAVAVAFQVVMVIGPNHSAAPVNTSVAVNYHCVNCLTYALAVQLFVTLDHPPSADETRRLRKLWAQIANYGRHLDEVPLSSIQKQIKAYEQQILTIVGPAQSSAASTTTSPSPGATTSATASDTASPAEVSSSPSATTSATGAPDPQTSTASPSSPAPTGMSTDGVSAPASPVDSPTPSSTAQPSSAASGTPSPSSSATTSTSSAAP